MTTIDSYTVLRIERKAQQVYPTRACPYSEVVALLVEYPEGATIAQVSDRLELSRGSARMMLRALIELRAVSTAQQGRLLLHRLNVDDLDVLF